MHLSTKNVVKSHLVKRLNVFKPTKSEDEVSADALVQFPVGRCLNWVEDQKGSAGESSMLCIRRSHRRISVAAIEQPVVVAKNGKHRAHARGIIVHPQKIAKNSTDSQSHDVRKKNRRHVHFSTIDIRELPRQLGDSPFVSTGIPVSFGWDVQRETTRWLDEFEDARGGQRRSGRNLTIPSRDRAAIVHESGAAWSEVEAVVTEIHRLKVEQAQNLQELASETRDQNNHSKGSMSHPSESAKPPALESAPAVFRQRRKTGVWSE